MTASAERLPISNTDVLAPTSTMADYAPQKHPNIGRFRSVVFQVIAELERIASAEWSPTFDPTLDEHDTRDFWLAFLQNVRHAHKQLLDGLTFRRFMRDVKKHTPDLQKPFEAARDSAIEQLRQIRAFYAVILDENDDDELGIDLLPPMDSDREPLRGPSVTIDW